MEKEKASCRGCGKPMPGDAYKYGRNSYGHKINYYGGYVCSERCDFNASLELERSMPGHGNAQNRLGTFAQDSFDKNWSD